MPLIFKASKLNQPLAMDHKKLAQAAKLFQEDENGDLIVSNSQKVKHDKLIKLENLQSLNKSNQVLSGSQELSQLSRKQDQKLSKALSQSQSQHSQSYINAEAKKIGVKPASIKFALSLIEADDDDEPFDEPGIELKEEVGFGLATASVAPKQSIKKETP
jgi:hypothetical protein